MNTPIKKNEMYTVKIDSIGSMGEGICKIDGFTVFVQNAVLEDIAQIKIVKVKKNYGYGKLIKILNPSPHRVDVLCEKYGKCGGCHLQNYKYQMQLEFKRNTVKDSIEHIAKINNVEVLPTIGMEYQWNYRNKAQFPIRFQDGKPNIGFYSARSHNVVDIENCNIQHDINIKVIQIIRKFIEDYNIEPYDETTGNGIIRHVFTRFGFKTKELMVCIIVNCKKFKYSSELIDRLKYIENIKSIVLNYNQNRNNVILGDKFETIWGNSFITDYIGDIKFEISANSFFQVNPIQTEVLYKKVVEYADINKDKIIIDAYCGIGTISLFLAPYAKKVYGVEIVESAIEDAKRNATINSIENAEFYVGKSEHIIPQLYKEQNIKADLFVLDPPRKGCDIKLINTILEVKPAKIIYVSCNPATLARDLEILKQAYKIEIVQPIDLFPQTHHIECVIVINLK